MDALVAAKDWALDAPHTIGDLVVVPLDATWYVASTAGGWIKDTTVEIYNTNPRVQAAAHTVFNGVVGLIGGAVTGVKVSRQWNGRGGPHPVSTSTLAISSAALAVTLGSSGYALVDCGSAALSGGQDAADRCAATTMRAAPLAAMPTGYIALEAVAADPTAAKEAVLRVVDNVVGVPLEAWRIGIEFALDIGFDERIQDTAGLVGKGIVALHVGSGVYTFFNTAEKGVVSGAAGSTVDIVALGALIKLASTNPYTCIPLALVQGGEMAYRIYTDSSALGDTVKEMAELPHVNAASVVAAGLVAVPVYVNQRGL